MLLLWVRKFREHYAKRGKSVSLEDCDQPLNLPGDSNVYSVLLFGARSRSPQIVTNFAVTMERRNFLKSTGAGVLAEALGAGTILGSLLPSGATAKPTNIPQPAATPPRLGRAEAPLSQDLSRYPGPWGETQLRHLLRRAMFGVPNSQFVAAQQLGSMDAVVQQLLACQDLTKVPLPAKFATWLDTFPTSYQSGSNAALNQATLMIWEVQEIVNWWFDQMMQEDLSIRQKMTLMWTNHFVTGSLTVNIPAYIFTYLMTCMKYALGNFKDFSYAISIDPAMLLYLNGNQNFVTTKRSDVNENYARELMELFTMGINFPGTSIPNYTQTDIENSSRALTGWTPTTTAPYVGQFNTARHDQTNKTFLGQTGNWGLQDILDIIFQQPDYSTSTPPGIPADLPAGYTSAYWASQTIYKTFVYYDPNATDPNGTVRDAMARLMIQNNFELAPVMQALLTSAHFYDSNVIGAQIKSPAEFAGSLVREFGFTYPAFDPSVPPVKGTNSKGLNEYADTNPSISALTGSMTLLGQQLLNPPNVAGWPGGENWLSAGSFQERQTISTVLMVSTKGYKGISPFSPSAYASQIPNYGTLDEGQLFGDLENVSLAFTLGPIESGELAPNPSSTTDLVDNAVPLFAPLLALLPEFQLL